MQNMRPEDIKRAQDQMKNMSAEEMMARTKDMDPSALQQQAEAYTRHVSAQAEYAYKASLQLKTDGNSLVQAQKFAEAALKYKR